MNIIRIIYCFLLLSQPVILKPQYWCHYLSIYWPGLISPESFKFDLPQWRQSSYDSYSALSQLRDNLKNIHNLTDNFRPFFDHGTNKSDAYGIEGTGIQTNLVTWLSKGVKFTPFRQDYSPWNESQLIAGLANISARAPIVHLQSRASFSTYTSLVGLAHKGSYSQWFNEYEQLIDLYRDHYHYINLPYNGSTYKTTMLKVHEVLVRMYSLLLANHWFRDNLPTQAEVIISLRKGFIPLSLLSPKLATNLVCDLAKRFAVSYRLLNPCNDWAYLLSSGMMSEAHSNDYLIIKILLPVEKHDFSLAINNLPKAPSIVPVIKEERDEFGLVLTSIFAFFHGFLGFIFYILAFLGVIAFIRDSSWIEFWGGLVLVFPPEVEAISFDSFRRLHESLPYAFSEIFLQVFAILLFLLALFSRYPKKVYFSQHRGRDTRSPQSSLCL